MSSEAPRTDAATSDSDDELDAVPGGPAAVESVELGFVEPVTAPGAADGSDAGAATTAGAGAGAGAGAAPSDGGGDDSDGECEPLASDTLLHRTLDWSAWDGGKAGGLPSWLDPEHIPRRSSLMCEQCGRQMVFLLQVYAPLDDVDAAFHRSLYVFTCAYASCVAAGSVRAFRFQLPKVNPYYTPEPPESDGPPAPGTAPRAAHTCAVCGLRGTSACGQCGAVRYCSREHQAVHWKAGHSKSCVPRTAAPSGDSPATAQVAPQATEIAVKGGEAGEAAAGAKPAKAKAKKKKNRSSKPPPKTVLKEWAIEVETEMSPDERAEVETNADAALLRKMKGQTSSKTDDEDPSIEGLTMEECNDATGGKLDADASMRAFAKRVSSQPEQVLRYARWKDNAALWVRNDHRPPSPIPACSCGAPRQFEFQIMPQLLFYLQQASAGATPATDLAAQAADALDFGTITVYTCTASCSAPVEALATPPEDAAAAPSADAAPASEAATDEFYRPEFVWVQAM